jgi:hypothetical protein
VLLLTAGIIVGVGATQLLHAGQEPVAVTVTEVQFCSDWLMVHSHQGFQMRLQVGRDAIIVPKSIIALPWASLVMSDHDCCMV